MKKLLLILSLFAFQEICAQQLLICHFDEIGIDLVAKYPDIKAINFSDWHSPQVQAYVAAGHPIPTVFPTVVDLDDNTFMQYATDIDTGTNLETVIVDPSTEDRLANIERRLDFICAALEIGKIKLDDEAKKKLEPWAVTVTSSVARPYIAHNGKKIFTDDKKLIDSAKQKK
jgi:hypothetical protein